MKIIPLQKEFTEQVEQIASNSWGDVLIVVHRELFDLRKLPCYIAISDDNKLLGYCYYRINNLECEVMAIESLVTYGSTTR